jgi:hypothetical protein
MEKRKGKIRKARNVTPFQAGITKSKTQKMIIMKNSPNTAVMSEPAPAAQGWRRRGFKTGSL